jgi:hypothetical protein
MATNPIRRMIKPARSGTDEKIIISAFFSQLQQWMDGEITGPNFRAAYGMDRADLSLVDGEVGKIRNIIEVAAMPFERRRFALLDIERLAHLSEANSDTKGYAQGPTMFLAECQVIVDKVKAAK